MKKALQLSLPFVVGIILGVLGTGWLLLSANAKWWEQRYDTGVWECVQRVHYAAHAHLGDSARAAEQIDASIANQMLGLIGRAAVVPPPARGEYGPRELAGLRLVRTYMELYPEEFETILAHPEFNTLEPLTIDELEAICTNTGICQNETVSLMLRLQQNAMSHDTYERE